MKNVILNSIQHPIKVRPILKWVGGKSILLNELLGRVPKEFGNYHEPFVGGGALFFSLASKADIKAHLSDINPSLIDVYVAIRECANDVIKILKRYRYDEDEYYKSRSLQPTSLPLPERAARMIYLNKTCFNGLYRENRAGQFNVPFGQHKNPIICDEENIVAASRVLQNATIVQQHFSSVVKTAKTGDFVYFDPPYHPVSATANFTNYDRSGFREKDQIQLRDIFVRLGKKRIKVMLSNSDTPYVRELYCNYSISQVHVSRRVNSKANSRGKVPELIICNF